MSAGTHTTGRCSPQFSNYVHAWAGCWLCSTEVQRYVLRNYLRYPTPLFTLLLRSLLLHGHKSNRRMRSSIESYSGPPPTTRSPYVNVPHGSSPVCMTLGKSLRLTGPGKKREIVMVVKSPIVHVLKYGFMELPCWRHRWLQAEQGHSANDSSRSRALIRQYPVGRLFPVSLPRSLFFLSSI